MKVIPILLVSFFVGAAAAQAQFGSDARDVENSENAWFRVPFEERVRRFLEEERDPDWAERTEQAIRERVAEFDRPLVEVIGPGACVFVTMCELEMPAVQTESVECRATLCRVELHWPTGTGNPVIGQQLSFLSEAGIDHQGEIRTDDDGSRYRVEMIARRRP